MTSNSIEFYTTPQGNVIIKEDNKPERELKESDTEFIQAFLKIIDDFYPEAYMSLFEIYSRSRLNKSYYEFLMVKRFINCNFGAYDNILDIDENGTFNFEFIACPLHGECSYEGKICSPKFNNNLTDREYEVMKRIYTMKRNNPAQDALSDFFVENNEYLTITIARLQKDFNGTASYMDYLFFIFEANKYLMEKRNQ
jgi:hypothetical protein